MYSYITVLATAATLVTASPIHRIKAGSDSHSSMNAGYPGMVFVTEFPTVSSLPAVHTHAPRKEAQLIPPNALTATFDVGPGSVVHSSIAASTSTVASPKATTFTTNTVFSTRTVTLPSTTSANLNAPSTVAVLPTGTFVLPPSRPKDPPHLRPTCRVPDAGYPPPIGGCYPGCDKNGDGFCGAADEAGLYPPIIPYPLHTATLPARAAVNTAAPLAKREGGKDVLLAFGRMAGLEPDLIDGPPHTAPTSPPVEKRQGGEDDWKALKLGFGPSVPITRPSSRPHGKPDGLVGVKPTPINALPPAAPVPKPPHGIAAVQPTPINVLPPAAPVSKPPHGIAAVQPTPINVLPPTATVSKPPHGIAAVQPTPVNALPAPATVPKPPHGIAAVQPTPVNVVPPPSHAVAVEARGQIKWRICFNGVKSWKCQVTCGSSDDPATCVGGD